MPDGGDEEHQLSGGRTSGRVVRVGDSVRRVAGPRSEATAEILRGLEQAGFTGAPRWRGVDEQGREVLSFVDGEVVPLASPAIGAARLASVGGLVAELHRASRRWLAGRASRPDLEDQAVLRHNDLSPSNTVFDADRAVAFVDWDLADVGEAEWDLAHAVWQFAPLATDAFCETCGWRRGMPDRGARARALLDGYGLSGTRRLRILELVAPRMTATIDGIRTLGREGKPAFTRLVDDGVDARLERDLAWFTAHAAAIGRSVV